MEEPIDFDYLMQSQPKIIIWARKEAIKYPPEPNELAVNYLIRRIRERNWIMKVDNIIKSISKDLSMNENSNDEDKRSNDKGNEPEDESAIIHSKVQDALKNNKHDSINCAKVIISIINKSEYEADADTRILALNAPHISQFDQQSEQNYLNVWNTSKSGLELLSSWFEDACSDKKQEVKLWKSTLLPILMCFNKLQFKSDYLKKKNFLDLVKRLTASTNPNVRTLSTQLQERWSKIMKPTNKRTSNDVTSNDDVTSKKQKVDNANTSKTSNSFFNSTNKDSKTSLPSFKKTPKVQEIQPPVTNNGNPIPSSNNKSTQSISKPTQPPAKRQQNAFADALATMSQSKPPPPTNAQLQKQRQQHQQQQQQAQQQKTSNEHPQKSKKQKSVRFDDNNLTSYRYIESLEESLQYVDHDHHSVKELEIDEGAALKQHMMVEDEETTPKLIEWLEPFIYEHTLPPEVPQKGSESAEKSVQETRESITLMQTYFNDSQIPYTPLESQQILDSKSDDSITTKMIESEVSQAPFDMNNQLPGSQFGNSIGTLPGNFNSLSYEQHNLLQNLLNSNNGDNQYSIYDLPPTSSAFRQSTDHIKFDNGRDHSRDRSHNQRNYHNQNYRGDNKHRDRDDRRECRYYKNGNCKNGNRCPFKHS